MTEGPAKLVWLDDNAGVDVVVDGNLISRVFASEYCNPFAVAFSMAKPINDAFRPLVEKAAMADRLADVLRKRYADRSWWRDVDHDAYGPDWCFDWKNDTRDYEHPAEMAEEILAEYDKLKGVECDEPIGKTS